MTLKIITVRVGQPFVHGNRYLVISHARKEHLCHCGNHDIARGDLYVRMYDSGGHGPDRLHISHITEYCSLVLVGRHGEEVAHYGP